MAFLKIAESAAALAKKIRTVLVGDEHLQAMVPHAADGTPVAMNAGAADNATPRVISASNDPLVTRLGEVQESPTQYTVLDRLKAIETAIGDIPGGGGGGGGDVNLVEIGGTAVAAGAGAASAGTPRVILASDDPAVAALGAPADAAATQGSTGTVSAKLRTVTSQLNTLAGHLDGVEAALAPLALESGGNLAALVARLGEVTASPTANTVLDRLKTIGTQLTAGATAVAKAEDAASAGGDVGMPAMAIQTATPADTAADNDYAMLQMKGGRQWVSGPGGVTCQVSVTRPNDTAAYVANDHFADSTTVPTAGGFTITNAGRFSGGSGVIKSVRADYSTKPGTRPQFLLLLFDSAPTAGNDNAQEALSDADRQKLIPGGAIPIACVQDFANGCYGQATGLDIFFTCSGSANLRLLIICLNGFTPAAQDVLHLRFGIEYRD